MYRVEYILEAFLKCNGVCTDSRKVVPGAMFFALRGDNFDGNQYAASAIKAGAAFVVVDDPLVLPAIVAAVADSAAVAADSDADNVVVDAGGTSTATVFWNKAVVAGTTGAVAPSVTTATTCDPAAAGTTAAAAPAATCATNAVSVPAPPTTPCAPAPQSSRYILVDDTLEALQSLATAYRKKLGITILAITGSNGKTTTKELLSRVISRKFATATTVGNLNNHIGVPLTILAMNSRTEFGIVEMGANHVGEIAALCGIAAPDYGLITNVGRAHLEGFGSFEGVKKGKGEMFDWLATHSGTAFYMSDSRELVEMATSREGLTAIPYSASAFKAKEGGDHLSIEYEGLEICTRLVGHYNLFNVAAAFALGRYFGVEDSEIVSSIESYVPDNNRSQRIQGQRNEIIMDAYNANPSSMRAAIENFAAESSTRAKVVVLGDMRELGDFSGAEHRAIVLLLRALGLNEAYLVGQEFTKAVAECGDQCAESKSSMRTFADVTKLTEYLGESPLCHKLVLVKGSRGLTLERTLDFLETV